MVSESSKCKGQVVNEQGSSCSQAPLVSMIALRVLGFTRTWAYV